MPHTWNEDLLILTKTYPNPSSKYSETTCVAAINKEGNLRRLYPVPFRLLDGSQKFEKWEWITSDLHKATDDHRPESHQLHIDTLKRTGRKVTTADYWKNRIHVIAKNLVPGFVNLEDRRQATGETLGFIGPVEIVDLEITEADKPDWTEEDVKKLTQESLFDDELKKNLKPLKKLPHEFRYVYRVGNSPTEYKHMVTDWEAGALYWNCVRSHGNEWKTPFIEKLVHEFSTKDLYFLMGTVHRFPSTWLIVGLYYPPKSNGEVGQGEMF